MSKDLTEVRFLLAAGNKQAARLELIKILRTDVSNEAAWLLLAETAENDVERRQILERCLKVLPQSETVRQALVRLQAAGKANATEFVPPAVPPAKPSLPEPPAVQEASPAPKEEPHQPEKKKRNPWLIVGGVTWAVVMVLLIAFIVYMNGHPRVAKPTPTGTATTVKTATPAPTNTPVPTPTNTPTPVSFPALAGDRQVISPSNLDQVRLLAVLNEGIIFDSASNRFAGFEGDRVILWDAAKNAQQAGFALPGRAITGLAFSPDGRKIAVGTDDLKITVWDLEKNEAAGEYAFYSMSQVFDGSPQAAQYSRQVRMGFSPDGKILAASAVGLWQAWDLEKGIVIGSQAALQPAMIKSVLANLGQNPGQLYDPYYTFAFSPDSQVVAVVGYLSMAAYRPGLGIFHSEDLATLEQCAILFSPDSRTMVLSGATFLAWELDLQSAQKARPINNIGAAYSPDGAVAFSADSTSIQVEENAGYGGNFNVVVRTYSLPDGKMAGESVSPSRYGFLNQSQDGQIGITGHVDDNTVTLTGSGKTVTLPGQFQIYFTPDMRALTAVQRGRLAIYGVSSSQTTAELPPEAINLGGHIERSAADTLRLWPAGDQAVACLSGALKKYDPARHILVDVAPVKDPCLYAQTASAGKYYYFSTYNALQGLATLWKTDGSAAGTKQVNPADWSSQYLATLMPAGDRLYLAGGSIQQVNRVWQDIGGTLTAIPALDNVSPAKFTAIGGTLYFISGSDQPALWRTDGTQAGTYQIGEGQVSGLEALAAAQGTLFVTARDGDAYSLWKSDGTPTGISKIKQLSIALPGPVIAAGKFLFLLGNNLQGQTELWRSDGTSEGTILLKTFAGDPDLNPRQAIAAGDRLFFFANVSAYGLEPWISDGTESGTVLLKDIRTGSESSMEAYGNASTSPKMIYANGVIYFAANDGLSGMELWQSDGTQTGTLLASDVQPGPASSYPEEMYLVGDKISFTTAGQGSSGPVSSLWIYPP